MYNGVNLYACNMTETERAAAEGLRQELITICDSMDVPRGKCVDGSPYMGRLKDDHDFMIKYKRSVGFFALCGERGLFSLWTGFPTKDKEKAKFILLKHEFWVGGCMYECDMRKVFEKEWAYSVEYDSRKYTFEYVIRMLKLVFGRFPEQVIDEYNNYMNKWFDTIHWYYDKDKMTFEESDKREGK